MNENFSNIQYFRQDILVGQSSNEEHDTADKVDGGVVPGEEEVRRFDLQVGAG